MPVGYDLADMRVDLDKHEYYWRERRLPGVTTILRVGGWSYPTTGGPGFFAGAALGAALARGTAVHAHAAALDEGLPTDPEAVTEATIDYVAADAKLRRVLPAVGDVIATECPLVHPPLGYGGRIDSVRWYHGYRVIADRKTGSTIHPSTWLQLAGYKKLWNFWYPETPVVQTVVFLLSKNAEPRVVDNPVENWASQVFLAALQRYLWITRMERRRDTYDDSQ